MPETQTFSIARTARRLGLAAFVSILTLGGAAGAWAADASDSAAPTATEVFTLLGGLAGEWQATIGYEGAADKKEAGHLFRTASNNTVVMETMWPGGDHEMINMYFMEGNDLVLTHYCAGGNQPKMRYEPGSSSADHLHFVFAGGTNLDPAKDGHIHAAEILLGDREQGKVVSHWHGYAEGKHVSTQVFALERVD